MRLRNEFGLDPAAVHVIPHGPLDYLPRIPDRAPLPAEFAAADPDVPVVLFFGLLRPYKGIDTLLEAFAQLDPDGAAGKAELWIAGMPRMPIEPLQELARKAPGTVRWLPRFVTDAEIPALMERADVLALPYREIEQSGVLHAGLAFGKAMVLGDVGGFGEFGREQGAARLVPPGDVDGARRRPGRAARGPRRARAPRDRRPGRRLRRARLGCDRRADDPPVPDPARRLGAVLSGAPSADNHSTDEGPFTLLGRRRADRAHPRHLPARRWRRSSACAAAARAHCPCPASSLPSRS